MCEMRRIKSLKRYFAVIAALLCLASCGEVDDSSESSAKEDSSAAASVTQTEAVTSASPETVTETVTEKVTEAAPETSSAEEYPTEYSLEINEPDAPQVTGVTLKASQPKGLCKLENVYKTDVLATGTVGLVGCPVRVELKAKLGKLSFAVDTDKLGAMPFENLAVLKTGQGEDFEVIPFVREENSIVCAITESDTYMLVDLYQWQSAWSGDVSAPEHETDFTVGDEFNFRITMPEGVAPNNVSSMWEKTPIEGRYEVMTKQLLFQNRQSDAKIKAEMTAYRYPGEDDGCDDPLPMKSFDEKFSEIKSIPGDQFDAEVSEMWDIGGGRRGFMAVFHFPEEPESGINEQTIVEGFYEVSEDTYILCALSFNGQDQSTTDSCVKSIKSFKYSK